MTSPTIAIVRTGGASQINLSYLAPLRDALVPILIVNDGVPYEMVESYPIAAGAVGQPVLPVIHPAGVVPCSHWDEILPHVWSETPLARCARLLLLDAYTDLRGGGAQSWRVGAAPITTPYRRAGFGTSSWFNPFSLQLTPHVVYPRGLPHEERSTAFESYLVEASYGPPLAPVVHQGLCGGDPDLWAIEALARDVPRLGALRYPDPFEVRTQPIALQLGYCEIDPALLPLLWFDPTLRARGVDDLFAGDLLQDAAHHLGDPITVGGLGAYAIRRRHRRRDTVVPEALPDAVAQAESPLLLHHWRKAIGQAFFYGDIPTLSGRTRYAHVAQHLARHLLEAPLEEVAARYVDPIRLYAAGLLAWAVRFC